jgi:pimeloyl-ACP methyl ester carboxylesterase
MADWSDLTAALKGSLNKFNELLQSDAQLRAFTTSNAIEKAATFGIKSSGSDNTLLISVTNGSAKASTGTPKDALFTLSALPEQWEQHFQKVPKMPYQSYWGMFGMNIKQKGIEVQGDQTAYAHWTHVWRRVLELAHDAQCGPMPMDEQEEPEEDHIVGRYLYLEAPVWGRSKVFYEWAGEGKQAIVFLHTAGSDSRQYHGVMNDARMRKKCTMYAFDLPGHGRSFPSKNYYPGAHTNTEDSYVGIIASFVTELRLRRPIICGASMAGQVCLAVAIRHKEVGAAGTIPLQGLVESCSNSRRVQVANTVRSEYLNMERQWHDRSPYVNQSLFNPEWVYGVRISSTSRR